MSLQLPSRIEAWSRIRDATPPEWVLRHVRAVEALAVAIAERAANQHLSVNLNLVARGALLHDIGRSVTQDLRHAYIGADLVRETGWSEPLACIVERHTGAGIGDGDARLHGLPERDYVPHTLEERIVAHADNLYSGDKRQDLAAIEAKYRSRGLDHAWLAIEALHDELSAQLDVDLESLAPSKLPDLP